MADDAGMKILLIAGAGLALWWWWESQQPAAASTVASTTGTTPTTTSVPTTTTTSPTTTTTTAPTTTTTTAPATTPAVPYANTLAKLTAAIQAAGYSTTSSMLSADEWNYYAAQVITGWTPPSPETLYPSLASIPSTINPGLDQSHDPTNFSTWWTAVQPFLPAGLTGLGTVSRYFTGSEYWPYGGWN